MLIRATALPKHCPCLHPSPSPAIAPAPAPGQAGWHPQLPRQENGHACGTTCYFCMVNVSPWRHKTFPSNSGSSSVQWPSSPFLPRDVALWSCSDFGANPCCWRLVPYHVGCRGPVGRSRTPYLPTAAGRRLGRPSPPWQCCQPQGEQPGVGTGVHKARGPGKGKRGLPLTSGHLLSARDSRHCRGQGTRCKGAVQMLIKLIPAFMCLADKVGCWCSKFRLEKNNADGVGPWLRGWINNAGQPC